MPEWAQKIEPASASPGVSQIAAPTAAPQIKNRCKTKKPPRNRRFSSRRLVSKLTSKYGGRDKKLPESCPLFPKGKRNLPERKPWEISSWRKGQDSNLRGVNLPVFKTGALNHSATLPRLIITQGRGEGKLGSGFRLGADGSGAGEGAGVVKINRGKVGKLLAEHAYGLQNEPNSVR